MSKGLPLAVLSFDEPARETSLIKQPGLTTLYWEPDMPYPAGLETKYFVVYMHPRGEKLQKAISGEHLLTITQDPFFQLPHIDG